MGLIPFFIIILASRRVTLMQNVDFENYQDRVNQTVADTIKEQLGDRVRNPLFAQNNVNLPPGRTAFDLVDRLVPEDDVELLSVMYNNLTEFGINSEFYPQLINIVNMWWGG